MKYSLFYISIIIIALSFISCKNQQTETCTTLDWVGNYKGVCEGEVTLNVTVDSDKLILKLIKENGTETVTSSVSGCNSSFNLGSIHVEATLNGDKIIYKKSTVPCKSIVFTRV